MVILLDLHLNCFRSRASFLLLLFANASARASACILLHLLSSDASLLKLVLALMIVSLTLFLRLSVASVQLLTRLQRSRHQCARNSCEERERVKHPAKWRHLERRKRVTAITDADQLNCLRLMGYELT